MVVEKICESLFSSVPYRYRKIDTGKFNDSYFLEAEDKNFVLRIAPDDSVPQLFYEQNMMRREPGIHRLIREKTDIPIAKIISHDFSRSIVNRDWLLMERLPGVPLSQSSLWKFTGKDRQQSLFFTLGRYVREIHAIKNDWHGYPPGTDTLPRGKNWFDTFSGLWRNLLTDITKTGIYSNRETDWLSGLLEKQSGAFSHDPEPSLLHMDIWSQNILVDRNGNISGIVDWDRALWGDPEIDFSVLEYCGMTPPSFWKGYGLEPEERKDYMIRKTFYLLYEHQKYIFIRALRGKNFPLARRYAEESLKIAEQLQY